MILLQDFENSLNRKGKRMNMDRLGRRSSAALKSVLVLMFIMGSITAGNNAASAQEGRGPCREDAARLCKDVQPGGGRIIQCLKQHENELSAACKERIAQAKEKIQEVQQACQGDVDAYCKGVQPGGGRIIQCLKQHEGQLSPGCKEKIAQAKAPRQ
jgi:hypothetical protein